jgi:hypothetical protein
MSEPTEEERRHLWVVQQRAQQANRRRILAGLRGNAAAAKATRDNWDPILKAQLERKFDR